MLQEFLKKISQIEVDQDALIDQVERVLSDLARFCYNNVMSESLPEHQELLVDGEPLELFVAILEALPVPLQLGVLRTEKVRIKYKERGPQIDKWSRVRKAIFLLFKHICRQNHKNGYVLAAHLDQLTPWVTILSLCSSPSNLFDS